MATEDGKVILINQELREKIAARIDKMGDSDYGIGDKGMATVEVVEDEVFKFLGKVIIGAVSNLFKRG